MGLAAELSGDERTGVEIVQRALAAPLHHIADNAGFDPNVVAEEVRRSGNGFNAATGIYEDLLAAGILDAAKVVRLALQDAVSIAGLLLTTEAVIADKPEPPLRLPPAATWVAWAEWVAWVAWANGHARDDVIPSRIPTRPARGGHESGRPRGLHGAGRYRAAPALGSKPAVHPSVDRPPAPP